MPGLLRNLDSVLEEKDPSGCSGEDGVVCVVGRCDWRGVQLGGDSGM